MLETLAYLNLILKLAGLSLTGIFGMAGAMHDFRDQRGAVTRWGRRNLIGLALGLVISLGTLAGDFALKREEDRKSNQKTERLLAIATAVLNPLDRLRLGFSYSLPTDDPRKGNFDKQLLNNFQSTPSQPELNTLSNRLFDRLRYDQFAFQYLNQPTTLRIKIRRAKDNALLELVIHDSLTPNPNDQRQVYLQPHRRRLRILSDSHEADPEEYFLSKELFSIRDLAGAEVTFVLHRQRLSWDDQVAAIRKGGPVLIPVQPDSTVALEGVSLRLPGQLNIEIASDELKRVAGEPLPTYLFRFPEKFENVRQLTGVAKSDASQPCRS